MFELKNHRKVLGDAAAQAAEAWANRPPQEQFDELVRRGIIDKEGNVLVRMPYLDSDVVPEDREPTK